MRINENAYYGNNDTNEIASKNKLKLEMENLKDYYLQTVNQLLQMVVQELVNLLKTILTILE